MVATNFSTTKPPIMGVTWLSHSTLHARTSVESSWRKKTIPQYMDSAQWIVKTPPISYPLKLGLIMLSWVLHIWILLLKSAEQLQLHLKYVSSTSTQPFCKNLCSLYMKSIKCKKPKQLCSTDTYRQPAVVRFIESVTQYLILIFENFAI